MVKIKGFIMHAPKTYIYNIPSDITIIAQNEIHTMLS